MISVLTCTHLAIWPLFTYCMQRQFSVVPLTVNVATFNCTCSEEDFPKVSYKEENESMQWMFPELHVHAYLLSPLHS